MHETSQYHVQVRTRKYPLFPLFPGKVEKQRFREMWEGRVKDCPVLVLDPAVVGRNRRNSFPQAEGVHRGA